MKIIEISAGIPPGVKLTIKKLPEYSTYYRVIIHRKWWFNKQVDVQVNPLPTNEEILEVFAKIYYGTTYQVPTATSHPELAI